VQSLTCELGYGADTMFHRTYFLLLLILLLLLQSMQGAAQNITSFCDFATIYFSYSLEF